MFTVTFILTSVALTSCALYTSTLDRSLTLESLKSPTDSQKFFRLQRQYKLFSRLTVLLAFVFVFMIGSML